jgi:prepilin-type processing-associated H-X9-DG protein
MACVNKLRQWTLATGMYVEDNDGSLPREKATAGTNTWAMAALPANMDVWFNALPQEYLGERNLGDYVIGQDSFHSSESFFQCPSARFRPGEVDPIFSLVFNSKLNQSTDPLTVMKFCAIQNEAVTVLFLDAGIPGENKIYPSQKNYSAGLSSAWANRLSGRHQAGANLAFADGHVQWFRGSALVDPATGNNNTDTVEVRWTCP